MHDSFISLQAYEVVHHLGYEHFWEARGTLKIGHGLAAHQL